MHDLLNQQQFVCFLQADVEVGGGDWAGENLAHSPTLKPLKATVLFSIEVLY